MDVQADVNDRKSQSNDQKQHHAPHRTCKSSVQLCEEHFVPADHSTCPSGDDVSFTCKFPPSVSTRDTPLMSMCPKHRPGSAGVPLNYVMFERHRLRLRVVFSDPE